jgi:hypothetical protein
VDFNPKNMMTPHTNLISHTVGLDTATLSGSEPSRPLK